MDPADVTLVIPCYNVADTLPPVLTAIERLDPQPARILCVDDGSTDGTTGIIRRRDDIDLVEHAENRGLGTTLNTALTETDTPWMAKVDGDIVVEQDWLGRLCSIAREYNPALIQGRFREQITTKADKWREKHPSPTFPTSPCFNTPINGSNILARVDALEDIDGYDEEFTRAFDDIDLMFRLIKAGYRIYFSPDVHTTHIRTDTWRGVLRTAWSYHYDGLSGQGPPERMREVPIRIPGICLASARSITADLRRRDMDMLWFSLMRPFLHMKWDIDHAREN